MDVMVGPTFSIDVQSPPPYAGDHPTGNVFYAGDSSESDSSIGTPDDSDDQNDTVSPKRNRAEDEEEEEVQSKLKGLNSLDSLEDSLPINEAGRDYQTILLENQNPSRIYLKCPQ